MSLKDEIRNLSGNKRRFFLLRIADLEAEHARQICGIKQGTYNTWLQHEDFVTLYRRRDEFANDYRQEAIQLLRRDNQLEAVLLEGKVLLKMKEELDTGDYNLIRTNLGREVYSKLISELDAVPKVPALSWEQRVGQLNQFLINPQQEQISEPISAPQLDTPNTVEGEIVRGE